MSEEEGDGREEVLHHAVTQFRQSIARRVNALNTLGAARNAKKAALRDILAALTLDDGEEGKEGEEGEGGRRGRAPVEPRQKKSKKAGGRRSAAETAAALLSGQMVSGQDEEDKARRKKKKAKTKKAKKEKTVDHSTTTAAAAAAAASASSGSGGQQGAEVVEEAQEAQAHATPPVPPASGDGKEDGGAEAPVVCERCVRRRFMREEGLALVLRLVEDEVELCREKALDTLILYTTTLLQPCPHMNVATGTGTESGGEAATVAVGESLQAAAVCDADVAIVTAIANRYDAEGAREPAEEIRLKGCQLFHHVVRLMHAQDMQEEHLDALATEMLPVIPRMVADNYPEVKKEVSDTIRLLAAVVPAKVRLHNAALLRALVASMAHQQYRVRDKVLEAIGAVVLCGHDNPTRLFQETLLPSLRQCVFDRTSVVRCTFARVVTSWLTAREEGAPADPLPGRDVEYELVNLLISLVADDSSDVKAAATQGLDAVGAVSLAGLPEDAATRLMEAVSTVNGGQEPTATAIGSAESRALVRRLLPRLVAAVLEDVMHWTMQTRLRSVEQLAVLLRYAQGGIVDHLVSVLDVLALLTQEDEEDLCDKGAECCRVLGAIVDLPVLLDLVLPRVRGDVEGCDTVQHRTSGLCLLEYVLEGADLVQSQQSLELIAVVVDALSDRSLLESDAGEMERCGTFASLVAAVSVLLARIDGGSGSTNPTTTATAATFASNDVLVTKLCRTLVQPLSSQDAELVKDALFALDVLAGFVPDARLIGTDNTQRGTALMQVFFLPILQLVLGTADLENATVAREVRWEKQHPQRRAVDALVRHSQTAAVEHFGVLMPIWETHLQPENDPELRLVMMAQLEAVCSLAKPDKYAHHREAMTSRAEQLFRRIFIPNLVWKAGRVAATLRKITLAALYVVLRRRLVSQQVLFGVAGELLPLLKTNMEDFDSSARELVCLCLTVLFEALPGAFPDEPVRIMYPELLKRMDDSSDAVRVAACRSLTAFWRCADPAIFRGSMLQYMLEQLFVHLDDPDPAMQAEVFKVIEASIFIDVREVRSRAEKARASHRDAAQCDRLIALCAEHGGDDKDDV